MKYLGIFIDQNLTWKHHIDHVALKISRYVVLLSKLRHHVPTHTLITIKITANLMYDVRHKIAPSRIQKQFQDISNIHSHYTRSSASNNFYTQSSRLSIQLNSFSRTGSTIWNGISLTLRNHRKNDFTRKITSLLFDILISENSHLETCEIIHRIKHFDKLYWS